MGASRGLRAAEIRTSGDSADGNGRQHAVVLRARTSTYALNSDVLLPHSTRRRRHVRPLRQRLQGLDQDFDQLRNAARIQRRLQAVHVHPTLFVLHVRLAGRPRDAGQIPRRLVPVSRLRTHAYPTGQVCRCSYFRF